VAGWQGARGVPAQKTRGRRVWVPVLVRRRRFYFSADVHNDSAYRHIHRADLHRGLLECATHLGIVLHLNSRVVEVDPYGPSLVTKNGKRHTADLVVASDGELAFLQAHGLASITGCRAELNVP
jgi:2-polyprenyl-6-methoxyphenol hydroxylase-like FAD-dependent oxidoreductase